MITFIKGLLVLTNPQYAIIEAQGIGYKIYITASAFSKMPAIGSEVLLHTCFVIREFSQALYGFFSMEEKEAFEALMDVSGVGPKLALSIIGHLHLHELHRAVQERNLTSLCKVPGIGKKTAERLAIEMRDKIPLPSSFAGGYVAAVAPMTAEDQKISDAMRALINLGYSQLAAQKAIKQTLADLPESADLALLITTSLKKI